LSKENKVTYRQQYTRCGKQRCRKCQEGNGHGPYWYAYWSENGRTISKYIGVQLPDDVKAGRQAHIPRIVAGIDSDNAVSSFSREQVQINGQGEIASIHMQETQVLRVYLLGQFAVERKIDGVWRKAENRTWRRRARVLLGCLLSSPKRRMGREQIMEALWPDLDTITAANRLNGAVHELRRLLEPELTRPAASRMLRLEQDMLALADSSLIWVDAEAFESLISEAFTLLSHETVTAPCRKQAEQLLEEAQALYNGDYLLEELYAEWSGPRREAIRRSYSSLLFRLSELRAQRGAYASAVEPLDRLLASDPVNETAVRQLMLLLTRLDRRTEALHTYRRLVAALQRDYDTEPLPETRVLYEALKKGNLSPTAQANTSNRAPLENPRPAGTLKNKAVEPSAPVKAQEVAFSRPVFQPGRHNQSPLIGRGRELDTMRQLLLAIEGITGSPPGNRAPARSSMPHFLLLSGEAGIGKTRLAEELSMEANQREWAVVWSRSYEQESTLPYRPWTELLHALVQDVPPSHLLAVLKEHVPGFEETVATRLERLFALLPALAGHPYDAARSTPALPPEQERLHLWETTLGLVNALSQKTPLLLVLDDLHWTDESSIDLLAYLARHLQSQRVLLVATYRDTEPTASPRLRTLINDLRREQAVLTLPVQPLTSTQIGSLVSYLPEELVRRIQTQAGGNPFFAEELARCSLPEADKYREASTRTSPSSGLAEREQEILSLSPSSEPMEGGAVPEAITAVLERRLGSLSSQCQNLLSRATILGGSFELDHLIAIGDYDEDTLLDLLEEALRAGLLSEEGSGERIIYHFWHPLIVNHLYERLSAARRARLHRRVATMLEERYMEKGHEGAPAATILYHLSKGGNDPARFARYAILAAHQAYAIAAYAEAKQYYVQAIQMLSHDLSSTVDALQLARLQERVCECCMVLGNYVEARQRYEQILQLRRAVDPGPREVQIQALIWREIGRTWSATGDYLLAYECFEQGKQVLSKAGITGGPAWACLLIQHGAICCLQGSYEQARSYIYEGLEILERTMQDTQQPADGDFQTRTEQAIAGDPLELGRAHELLGVVAASVGQPPEALKHLYTALDIFERHGLVIAMAKVCGNLGAVYAMKAENRQARIYMRRSLELTERMGDLPNMAFVTGNLGEMASRCGDLQEAEEWFMRSLTISEQINDREHSSWCNVALGSVRQALGKFHEAADNLRHALALGRAMKNPRCIGSALVAQADLRINQAIAAGALHLPSLVPQERQVDEHSSVWKHTATFASSSSPMARCLRLLLRARATLRKALAIEGLETELITEGKSLQAITSFLLGELETARMQALQTLHEAEEYEIPRMLARSHCLLGRIMTIQGAFEQAATAFEQALGIFLENEMRLDYARTLHCYGLSLLQHSGAGEADYRRGISLLQQARDIFAACHAAIDLEWVSFQLTDYERRQVALLAKDS
jgi:DNA-binding SARP family transcriptional activator/Tfp pilus assembly protein PilF